MKAVCSFLSPIVAFVLAASASAETPAAPVSGKGSLTLSISGQNVEVFTYRPAGFTNGPLLIVMHGVNRNAEDYRDFAVPLADKLGMLVVAPHFDKERFPSEAYQRGNVLAEGVARSREEWTYSAIPLIVEEVRRREGRADMPYFALGHSAGGQFLTRMAAFLPGDAKRIVAGNPGTHLFPTRELPFPYGFGGLPEELGGDEAIKRYLAAPLTLLLGTEDTGSEHLDVSETAMKQGATRLERGRRCFRMAQALAKEKGWPFQWRLVEVEGIGHDASKMLATTEAAAALTVMNVAQKAAPALPAPTFANVSYGTHERHVLDFWQAKSGKPTPLLIFIHGGGWRGGEKTDVPAKLLDFMLQHGVSVASINYRFTNMALLPAPVHDAARAVQFLRSKAAEWNLDAQRFGAYGISAGATTSLWLAYHDDLADAKSSDPVARLSTRLRAAVALSPQTCLEPPIMQEWVGDQVLQHAMMARAVGAKKLEELKDPKPEWLELLHEFSPITHVTADDPPVLVSNPRVDPLPATSAGSAIHHAIFGVKLKERCDAAGVRCTLLIQEKADPSVPTPEAFLLQQLRPE